MVIGYVWSEIEIKSVQLEEINKNETKYFVVELRSPNRRKFQIKNR